MHSMWEKSRENIKGCMVRPGGDGSLIWASHTLSLIDSLAQDCNNAIANALELLQSCTKSSICRSPMVRRAL